ncbi:hypothetical protein CEXT_105711 [Caerostris extrusa]|uniref:Uncharacterized protein n=1 Tax=Caerostris extrusa TaxID=172846 RepID=A0AAV4P6M0_CAEEX|nr:hypothetical protein CEXT_105711 [Caerostris extrusa]
MASFLSHLQTSNLHSSFHFQALALKSHSTHPIRCPLSPNPANRLQQATKVFSSTLFEILYTPPDSSFHILELKKITFSQYIPMQPFR